MTTYRTRAAERGDEALPGSELPCSACSTPTPRETLGSFGARCYPCYAAYCRDVPHWSPERKAIQREAGTGPLAWARCIVLRVERNVDPPSAAALSMAREALARNAHTRAPEAADHAKPLSFADLPHLGAEA